MKLSAVAALGFLLGTLVTSVIAGALWYTTQYKLSLYYMEYYANADSLRHHAGLVHFYNADPDGMSFYDYALCQLQKQMNIVEEQLEQELSPPYTIPRVLRDMPERAIAGNLAYGEEILAKAGVPLVCTTRETYP